MAKKVFISTSIPYVNGKPHIGHTLEFVQANALARAYRAGGAEVFFSTGTDENSLTNVLAAEEEGAEVGSFVRKSAEHFKILTEKLAMETSSFIRTGEDKKHFLGAQKLWQKCLVAGDIYKKSYEGLYCVRCEEFKTAKDLINHRCPEHQNRELETVAEENYFFRLSKYEGEIKRLLANDLVKITPVGRKNEMLSFVESGLEDFSISRSIKRARGWGIPVPGDESQIMYVWFDALSNYITILDFANEGENYQKYWVASEKRVHCVGKGIARFHAVYWLGMLLSAKLPPPTDVLVHGYLTVDGQKISKSLGNGINPVPLIDFYGAEAMHYYLLAEVSPFEDSDFTLEKFKESYLGSLVNGLGNITSRLLTLSAKHLKDIEISNDQQLFNSVQEKIFLGEFHLAAGEVFSALRDLDRQIQAEAPYKVIKEDEARGREILQKLLKRFSEVNSALKIFMPETAEAIAKCLKNNQPPRPVLFERKEFSSTS